MATGLVATLGLESMAYFRVFAFPAGVTGTAVALVLSLLVFFVVSWATRHGDGAAIPADVRAVMDV
jgi:hypothetical protein